MVFSLRPITGTPNFLIRQTSPDGPGVVLVAEIVEFPEGYTLYRMDATGQLAASLPTPESALEFYENWFTTTNPTIQGISED